MARPKKAAAKPAAEPKPKEKKITLTKEQFNSLREVSELVGEARRILNNLDEADTLSALAFAAGKAYVSVDKAEDLIDDVINEFDNELDYDSEWTDKF